MNKYNNILFFIINFKILKIYIKKYKKLYQKNKKWVAYVLSN